MKITIFCPYYPPHIGGLEMHSDEFNKYLSEKGIDITVFTPRLPKTSLGNETRYNNVKIIRFPAFEIIPSYPLPQFWNLRFWKLFFSLFEEKNDLAISRTRFFNTSLLALIYSKIKKIKLLHIEHGSDFPSLSNPLFSKIAKVYDLILGRLILNSSDLNIANSIASAEFCKKLSSQKKCTVIYRGVEIDKIDDAKPRIALREKFKNQSIITYVGRLINAKGVGNLIRAVSKINDIKCFIIGDGPQKEYFKQIAKKYSPGKVIFFGFRKTREVMSILKISDIFVNPSYNEGLPSSVIEAALCKNAIIATNVGGTPEIITDGKSGFLIAPKNVNQIKEKLEILINDEELRKQLGQNAYKEVINKFNWNNSTEKYLKIFNEINNG